MKYTLFLILPFLGIGFNPFLSNAPKTGKELLQKSIAYHDADGKLIAGKSILKLNEPRPGGEDRFTTLTFHPAKEFCSIQRKSGTDDIYMESNAGQFSYTVNGKAEASEEQIEKYKLNEQRLNLLRNYYHYLWFLPGKLNDPGTIIHDDIPVKDFFGKKGYQLKVTYDPAVGKDIWYFYFDLEDYELIGYRFYHDESKNDGEYILLDGEIVHDNVRIPARRKWYKHQQDEYLGEDILIELTVE